MYPLGHQDLAAARVAMAGHNSSASEPSLHRHRTTSSRLSCISEHQKENTPNSEDDCFPFPAQFAQTPSLVPVRRTHSDRHTSRKSRSSGDSSAANALQLDSEQTEGVGPQGKHHRLALSTWGRVAPTGPEERIERHDARDTKFSRSASPEILEMKWQITQRTGQAGNMNIKEHAFAILGLGLDGPRSSTSGSSPLDSPSHISRLPLGALSLSNCMATKPRSSKSNTSGSIDWDKSWPKRKPQRRHDVSESSDRGPSAHKSLIDTTALEMRRKKEMAPLTHEEQEDQSRLSEGQEATPQSHPEFFQRPPSTIQPTTSRFSPETVYGLESPDYSHVDSSRHEHRREHRHYFQDTISKRFRSLRDRLHRSRSSSMFSVRPEFPPPPDGKERRYRSRNSNDIWPSSGEESPIFNTPESNMSPMPPTRHSADLLLAASGLMMAAADIDRLTGSSYEGNRTRIPGTKSLELPRPRLPSSPDSPRSEIEPSVADTTPIVPTNSPSALCSSMGSTSPMAKPPRGLGRKSRRQPSRLSEVTTPDEIAHSTASADGGVVLPHLFWSAADIPQPTSQNMEIEGPQNSTSRPLSVIRPPSSGDTSNTNGTSFGSAPALTHCAGALEDFSAVVGSENTRSEPPSSRRSIPDQHRSQADLGDGENSNENALEKMPVTIHYSAVPSKSELNEEQSLRAELERIDLVARESALFADAMERLHSADDDSTRGECGSHSCHPDTWSEDQGEPGDSEPFCPPECLSSNRCHHNSEP